MENYLAKHPEKQLIQSEKEITRIFISHIDNVIENERWETVLLLIDIYIKNIDKRNKFPIGYDIFPKIFEWNKKFLELEKTLQNRGNFKEKLEKSISESHFPTFKKCILRTLEKVSVKTSFFYSGGYFRAVLFPKIAKTLLYDKNLPHQFFSVFKTFIDKIEVKLEKCENKDKKDKLHKDIEKWFSKFCSIFLKIFIKCLKKNISGKSIFLKNGK